MNSSYITPFIFAIKNVFHTMLGLTITFGKPELRSAIPSQAFDVSGLIGMSGDLIGLVMLNFPLESAKGIINQFTGMEIDVNSEDFGDAVGELVNMISGSAKAQFEGKNVSISCPSVVVGENHKIQMPSDSICITIPCESDCGRFAVEICIKKSCLDLGTNTTKDTVKAA